MARPTGDIEYCLTRAIGYLASHIGRGVDVSRTNGCIILVHLDRQRLGWGCDFPQVVQGRAYPAQWGGGHLPLERDPGNMALSAGGAELNRAVKCISEGIGVRSVIRELFGEDRNTILCVVASA